jgi:Zn-dependent protease with chaperone function
VTVAVHVALLAGVLLVARPVTRAATTLPDRLGPTPALRLLVVSSVLWAGASTAALGLLVLDAGARIPTIAALDAWSLAVLTSTRPWAPAVGVVAAVVAAVLALRVARSGRALVRSYRQAWAVAPPSREGSDLVIVTDDVPYAVAVPGRGRRRGRVVVTTAMFQALDDEDERLALVAHERAHLAGHHHALLAVSALAAAVNPLLTAVRGAIEYAVERRADEAAADVVGDRGIVARAIGHATLARRDVPPGPGGPAGMPAVTAGPIPRRITSLLAPDRPERRPGDHLAPRGLLLAAVVAAAAACWAGLDMHALIELAEGGRS